MSDQTQLDITSKILEYWNELPLIKKVDNLNDFNFLTNENRSKIISVLSMGLKDVNNLDNKDFIRHALTVQEIQAQIKDVHKYDITETNTHFHIQKLIEKGFIQEVLEIKTGRRPKKYFGRTAKIFLNNAESDKFNIEEDEFTKRLILLIEKINPKFSREQIIQEFEDMYRKKSKLELEKIGDWIQNYKEEVIESEIEFKELFLYINKALTFNNEFVEFYNRILKMLNYSE